MLLQMAKQNLLCTRNQGSHKRLSQTCLWVFECLLQRHRSAVACRGDRGSGCSRPGTRQHVAQTLLEEAAISSTIDLPSWRPQTAEQLYYQRNSHTVKKVLGPTTDFPTWGSSKGTENLQGIWLWRPVRFVIELLQDWGNRLLEGTNKILSAPGARRKEQWPHKTCLWVSGSLWQRCGLTVACHWGQGHRIQQCGHKSFWRRSPLSTLSLQ